MSDDRTVHAQHTDGTEIVRYDRQGHWFIEAPYGANGTPETTRQRVRIHDAVRTSIGDGWTHHPGLPGGGDFDRLRGNMEASRDS